MTGWLTGKTKLETASDDEKQLAGLLNEMKGSLIMEGKHSIDAIEGCLSLLKEIEAGEVSEVWSGKGAGAVPTYILGDKSQAGNAQAQIEELKQDFDELTNLEKKFNKEVDRTGLPDPDDKK